MAITASRTTDRRGLRAERLDLPDAGRSVPFPRVDRESVSRFAETIARFLGTGRYLTIQTGVVIVWIALNIAVPLMRWDPYPFILLNLAFSTQAAYAAPLILLAQNRQDDRDRAALTEDRAVAGRMREDTEFLTREVAALRLAQSEAATRQYVRGELAGQLEALRGDLEGLLLEAIRASLVAVPSAAAAVPASAAVAAGTAEVTGAAGASGIPDPQGAADVARTAGVTGTGRTAAKTRGNGAALAPEAGGVSTTRGARRSKGARRARAALAASTTGATTAELEAGAATATQAEAEGGAITAAHHARYPLDGRQNSTKRVIRPQRVPARDTSDDCPHRRGPSQ
ncbi:conserved hypothetical protein [Frankia canadensis]|uniref:DUF1003 domain-containing protein n=1 Tax=Frankia canadensis TaxID=1836972 RepID=A0A2I2KQH6_9ACTN|nr:DUF1003 domain-containing protein [Frankia canadensis]SNQ47917.1 conserved hypothetical protein [Frankia canadensis]SOU55207.1 conserved hypothetical protein [Frankia canadensis]